MNKHKELIADAENIIVKFSAYEKVKPIENWRRRNVQFKYDILWRRPQVCIV